MHNLSSSLQSSTNLSNPSSMMVLAAQLRSEIQTRRNTNRLSAYSAYPKQLEFHNAGKIHRERLLLAGNQLGKTYCGSMEASMHLTGEYPDWWDGRRWDRPVRGWAGSKTGEVTRDAPQRYLIGPPKDANEWGTGSIPKVNLIKTIRRQGVADALDGALIKHKSGGNSTVGFKSYDQGREKWQGETLDFVWFDEEPPQDIYIEGLTRTNATEGCTFITFTPLLGMSEVVRSFILD